MAMATTAPEFFINVVGTFLTESDIGIGTVVGSNMYNTLAVPAIGCLAAAQVSLQYSIYYTITYKVFLFSQYNWTGGRLHEILSYTSAQ